MKLFHNVMLHISVASAVFNVGGGVFFFFGFGGAGDGGGGG